MSKRQSNGNENSARRTASKAARDEILYCERCGISFLWSKEDQSTRPVSEPFVRAQKRPATRPTRPSLCPGCCHLLPQSERARGLIKWFSHKKRYGFISRQGEPDLFVHRSDIRPGVRLRPDDLVEFTVIEGDRGPSAGDVSLLLRAKAAARTPSNGDPTSA